MTGAAISSIFLYMEFTTKTGGEMFTTEATEAKMWDSEKRNSPYSTVSDPYTDDDYCENCDSTVDYSVDQIHGTCKCEGGH